MISKDSIENLKNHLDVVDVISHFLEMKKSGANFKACCPFHGENTPSFVVSPAKQIYHCFGCGAGGDAIKFVMEYEKLSYPEAIEKLASMYNVHLEYENSTQKRQDVKILEEVNNYYQRLLVSNETCKEYLHQRGVSEYSVEKFEIGYAPKSYDTINFLKNNHYNLPEAIDLGVIDTGQNGLYARFIERITFPIYGLNGKIVGFGGRTITGHNAKYVNSPQTKVFNKSRLLYGYHLAKETIYKKNELIVTEGYLDVIMLHQAGFSNAVATLGTALTKEHLPLLKRGEPRVVVAYDGDKAGLNAAFKAATMLSHSEFDGGVVIFKNGMDPADMVNDGRIEELDTIFSKAQPFIPFVIDHVVSQYNLHEPQQKQKALNEANEYLKTLSPIYQDEYKRYIAQKLNVRESFVKTVNTSMQSYRAQEVNLSKIDIAELSIIKYILDDIKRLDKVLDIVDASMFEFHNNEFILLMQEPDNPALNGIMLNEQLKEFNSEEEFNQQLFKLLIKYYNQKLSQVNYDPDINFKDKTILVRKIKDNILQLRRGKLVSYNL